MNGIKKVVKLGNRSGFIVSLSWPSRGEHPIWYTFDGEFRHYRLIGLGVVRGEYSISLAITFFMLLFAISWPARHAVQTE